MPPNSMDLTKLVGNLFTNGPQRVDPPGTLPMLPTFFMKGLARVEDYRKLQQRRIMRGCKEGRSYSS